MTFHTSGNVSSKYLKDSIALKIQTSIKEETTDTPENRFIKYVLESFLFFCEEIQLKSKKGWPKKLPMEKKHENAKNIKSSYPRRAPSLS
jgi:predicted component of viral defense system (DUF524 family)